MRGWGDLTDEEKVAAAGDFLHGVKYKELHAKYQIGKRHYACFDRKVRAGRRWMQMVSKQPQAATPIDLAELKKLIKNKPTPLSTLSAVFDRSEETVRKAVDVLIHGEHLNVVYQRRQVLLDTKNPPRYKAALTALYDQPAMNIRIAVASDIHAGSAEQQITAVGTFIKDAYEQGVRDVFVPGDVCAGCNVYRGQVYDLFAHGASQQVRVADFTLPQMDGMRYHVIGGNHDYSFTKADGSDAIRRLCARREDMNYYGYDVGDVALTANCIVRMWHPSGGVPYAKSYRLQKAMEQYNHDPRIKLVLAGHLHIALGPVKEGHLYGMQCGCFEGQTNYLARKGLFPSVGGWVIDMGIGEDGNLKRLQTEWLDYPAITGDHRNYPGIEFAPNETRETLYEWIA